MSCAPCHVQPADDRGCISIRGCSAKMTDALMQPQILMQKYFMRLGNWIYPRPWYTIGLAFAGERGGLIHAPFVVCGKYIDLVSLQSQAFSSAALEIFTIYIYNRVILTGALQVYCELVQSQAFSSSALDSLTSRQRRTAPNSSRRRTHVGPWTATRWTRPLGIRTRTVQYISKSHTITSQPLFKKYNLI